MITRRLGKLATAAFAVLTIPAWAHADLSETGSAGSSAGSGVQTPQGMVGANVNTATTGPQRSAPYANTNRRRDRGHWPARAAPRGGGPIDSTQVHRHRVLQSQPDDERGSAFDGSGPSR